MSKILFSAIILLGPVNHNGELLEKGAALTIPDEITEDEASRLILLGAAEVDKSKPIKVTDDDYLDDDPDEVSRLTKKQCIAELTAAKIEFNTKATVAELQKLVFDYRETLKAPGHEDKAIEDLTREELESELTARAIEFSADSTDDELRQLLIDDEDE